MPFYLTLIIFLILSPKIFPKISSPKMNIKMVRRWRKLSRYILKTLRNVLVFKPPLNRLKPGSGTCDQLSAAEGAAGPGGVGDGGAELHRQHRQQHAETAGHAVHQETQTETGAHHQPGAAPTAAAGTAEPPTAGVRAAAAAATAAAAAGTAAEQDGTAAGQDGTAAGQAVTEGATLVVAVNKISGLWHDVPSETIYRSRQRVPLLRM